MLSINRDFFASLFVKNTAVNMKSLCITIPVVYHSDIKTAMLFHIVEAIGAIVLVFVFAFLSYRVFTGNATNLFMIVPIVIASVVMWIVGNVVKIIQK